MKPVDIIVVINVLTLITILYLNDNVLGIKNKNTLNRKETHHNKIKRLNGEIKKLHNKSKYKSKTKHQEDAAVDGTTKAMKIPSTLKLNPQMAQSKKICWESAHIKHVEHRIINGANAKKGTFPWMVSIYLQPNKDTNKSDHICGGSIISTNFVLTAAHCLLLRYQPEQFSIHYGMHDRSSGAYLVKLVLKILPHPEFFSPDPEQSNSDIGLMKLKGSITYTNYVHPICVPYLTTPALWNAVRKEKDVVICGWGHTVTDPNGTSGTANRLKKGYTHLVNHAICTKEFSKQYYNQSTTFCLGKRSDESMLCSGDSGGPIIPLHYLPNNGSIVFPVVIGIVSFGNTLCFGPDVVTKVESYIDWINEWTSKL